MGHARHEHEHEHEHGWRMIMSMAGAHLALELHDAPHVLARPERPQVLVSQRVVRLRVALAL